MSYKFIEITPGIQKDINRQFRAVIARDKRLVKRHKEGSGQGHKDWAVNCPKCRVER
jgi:hypothetical protein